LDAKGRIIRTYAPSFAGAIPVGEGEIVAIIGDKKSDNDDWWRVRTSSGVEGYVPATYIDIQ
jgi:hypothetical protein